MEYVKATFVIVLNGCHFANQIHQYNYAEFVEHLASAKGWRKIGDMENFSFYSYDLQLKEPLQTIVLYDEDGKVSNVVYSYKNYEEAYPYLTNP